MRGRQALALPGVAGLHVMPVTPRGRDMAQALVRQRALWPRPQPARGAGAEAQEAAGSQVQGAAPTA